jgi:hypothetical protein
MNWGSLTNSVRGATGLLIAETLSVGLSVRPILLPQTIEIFDGVTGQ